ncbi:MAG: hypothetical protein H7Y05_03710 [Steroidobacteraceae bacterium]|nr:hypothetical protein [Deltaproteobacteria bacterium]
MRKLLTNLAELFRLPVSSGFAELDIQIDKLRLLRDSYQAPPQIQLHGNDSE